MQGGHLKQSHHLTIIYLVIFSVYGQPNNSGVCLDELSYYYNAPRTVHIRPLYRKNFEGGWVESVSIPIAHPPCKWIVLVHMHMLNVGFGDLISSSTEIMW